MLRFFVVVAALILCYHYISTPMPVATRTVIIEKKQTVMEIGNLLKQEGVIRSKNLFVFTFYLRQYFFKITQPESHYHLKAGEYKFSSSMTIIEIIEMMVKHKILQHRVIIPEGYSLWQIMARLAKEKSLFQLASFETAATLFQEGQLLPGSYTYIYGMTNLDILMQMQRNFKEFIRSEWPKRNVAIDKIVSSPEEAIILASIVEKETAVPEEREIIAGVYLNRLEIDMKLQASPTVAYAITMGMWHKSRITYAELKTDSVYNTYVQLGLPPTPICSPGKAAILAVLHPAETKYLYFVANGKGAHFFANDFTGHKKNRSIVQKY